MCQAALLYTTTLYGNLVWFAKERHGPGVSLRGKLLFSRRVFLRLLAQFFATRIFSLPEDTSIRWTFFKREIKPFRTAAWLNAELNQGEPAGGRLVIRDRVDARDLGGGDALEQAHGEVAKPWQAEF